MPHKDSPRYFDTLDILRGFAAVSMLVYHAIEMINWQNFPKAAQTPVIAYLSRHNILRNLPDELADTDAQRY